MKSFICSVILLTFIFPRTVSSEPCTVAHPVVDGESAPCEGVLWPQPWSLMAVKCRTVDLPDCKSENSANVRRVNACQTSLSRQGVACDKTINDIRSVCTGLPLDFRVPGWIVFVGGVIVGAAGTAFVMSR